MRTRAIEVGLDVFAGIWPARLPTETREDEILARVLKIKRLPAKQAPSLDRQSRPKSKRWTDVLIWALQELGGKATLSDIYRESRNGRLALGPSITVEHDASARECLEAHCQASKKFRRKADLFYMPEGKGEGVWALK